jgi:phosphatidylglycerophosphate synthase
MLDLHRDWFKGLEIKTAKTFAVLPVTLNQYTAFSIVFILVCDFFLVKGNYWPALGFYILAAAMDFIDGGVARMKKMSSPKGAYWDTIADRYVEAALLFGLLFVGLPNIFLPSFAWIFLALVGAIMTTYAKSAAKEKGLSEYELKGGLMSRGERLIFIAAILVLLNYSGRWAAILLALLAILSNFTALQRVRRAVK